MVDSFQLTREVRLSLTHQMTQKKRRDCFLLLSLFHLRHLRNLRNLRPLLGADRAD